MAAFFDKFKFGKKPPLGKAKASVAVPSAKIETAAAAPRQTGIAFRVLERVHQTEKSARLGTQNQYVFAVSSDATKLQVKDAVVRVYGVRPTNVNIVRVHGKRVRFGRTQGQQKSWKKAVITLPAGKSLNIASV